MSGNSTTHPSMDDPNAWVLYRYHPSLPASILFTVLFSLTTLTHCIYASKRRSWYLTPFIIGGIFEVIGYIGRAISSQDVWSLIPYIIQSLLLLLAPALFAASIYMTLGKIIRSVNAERYSLIPLKWLTKVFVAGDVLSFLIQMGGGGIQAGGSLSMVHLGETLIIVGLFVQLAFFGFFVCVAVLFQTRFNKHASTTTIPTTSIWRRHIYALYAGSGLILVRSVFRVVEYIMGNNGYLLRHEYFLYVFDAALMFGVMVLFVVVHPSGLGGVGVVGVDEEYSMCVSVQESPVQEHRQLGKGY